MSRRTETVPAAEVWAALTLLGCNLIHHDLYNYQVWHPKLAPFLVRRSRLTKILMAIEAGVDCP